MKLPPDQTAVFSAENLLSAAGMTVPKYFLTRSGYSRSARVHVQEEDALLLEILADGVVDDLGLVLRRDARQELALRLGDAQLVERVLDVRGHVVPVLLGAVLGGPHVVEDVVEVDLAQVSRPSSASASCRKMSQRAQAELQHPLRLVLDTPRSARRSRGRGPRRDLNAYCSGSLKPYL